MMYAVWKHEPETTSDFRAKLLGEVSKRLIEMGVHKVRISVVDDDVAAADSLRMETSKPPISGMISLWVDTAVNRKPLEDVIQAAAARMAGYLVTESEPIVNTRFVVPDGQRTPGMNQVVFLKKSVRLSYENWLEIWLGSHTQVAIDTQSTFGYRQNVIVRPLTYAAAFYDAVGDEEKRKKRETAMFQSCMRFIDFDKIDRIPTSEYVMKS
jgi:hypothetical protein